MDENEQKLRMMEKFDNSFDPPMECNLNVSFRDICSKHNYRYLETIYTNGDKEYVFYCVHCLEIKIKKV